jgi:hypothetical protein
MQYHPVIPTKLDLPDIFIIINIILFFSFLIIAFIIYS